MTNRYLIRIVGSYTHYTVQILSVMLGRLGIHLDDEANGRTLEFGVKESANFLLDRCDVSIVCVNSASE